MKLWLDAQFSPDIATWIAERFAIEAVPVRDVGLRDAADVEIFTAAKQARVVVVTKDSDFSHLIERLGSPPQIIWLRCGNTSFIAFVIVSVLRLRPPPSKPLEPTAIIAETEAIIPSRLARRVFPEL